MATYHLSVKYGKKGQAGEHSRYVGREGHYAYIAREGQFEERDDLSLTESGNMPEWARHDPTVFWDAADQYEGANRKTYVELEVSLPRELNDAQRVELVREFVQNVLGDRHAYTWAIHNPPASDGLEQPHVHLMFTERQNDGIARDPKQFFKRYNREHPEKGGAEKDPYFRHPKFVREIREEWAITANHFMSRHGIEARIDHRSYMAQGIDLEPSRKVGIATYAAERVAMAEVLSENRARAYRNGERLLINPAIAVHALTATQSVFSRRDVEQFVFRNTDGEEQFRQVYARVMNSKEMLALKDLSREGEWFTSAELRAIEGRLVERARVMSHGSAGPAGGRAIREKLRASRDFNDGQDQAFVALTSDAQLVTVNGAAGTGKSYVLAAAREAFEADGVRVIGAALQGKTADDMERDAGIHSRTLHSLISALEKGAVQLDSRTVVFVDEAGMVGSRQLEKLLDFAQSAGARVRLVGDAWQLHAVDAGDAFRAVSREAAAAGQLASLTEIVRQAEAWQRDASAALAQHRIREAVEAYAAHERIHLHANRSQAQEWLLAQWHVDHLVRPDDKQILLAHTNAARQALNEQARRFLRASGELGADDHWVQAGERRIAVARGERIMFGQNDYVMGVKNGTLATVEQIGLPAAGATHPGAVLHVRLNDGRQLRVDTAQYPYLDYGYALTVHKSQGVTVNRAYVLATPGMPAELAYVAMTRHKQALLVAGGRDDFADQDALVRGLSRGENKSFSGEHVARDREKEHGARHTIAVRRATQFSNAPRPQPKERSLTQAVTQYVDAWIKDRESRRVVKQYPEDRERMKTTTGRDVGQSPQIVHLAGDKAMLQRRRRELNRLDTGIGRELRDAMRERLRDDRAWKALVQLSGPERAHMLIAEVDEARTKGRAIDPRVFERPGRDAPQTDFRTLSPSEKLERREQHRRQRFERAGVPLPESGKAHRLDRSRGGRGLGND
ncbi:Ti-type conjugative transfer relaxase TraA [Trinickia violacea]|uniref:Ti-type conjugative transfer relaxase TraA n=1 Tax=Trinickia violacea TaxID=2571746 RepID=A0A4P8J2F2_9BURK|nr:AAA family ATPase [Trinickia violacea]QCP55137.1 Ti-type conjugative transfer relaxase TraA [Trinickia violacea]